MVISEENFELEKQIGCMAGIFQIFDRHHLLTGRRFGRQGQKRLPSGNASSKNRNGTQVQSKSSHEATLEKTLSKSLTENSSLSMESSRASCSSSSCSSFSSVNETFLTEKPSKETLKPKNALDLRDIVKDSINRESLRGLTVKTTKEEIEISKKPGLKRKDSPRPLLLSKSMDGTYVIGIDRSINNVHENNNIEYSSKYSSNYYSRYSCDGRDLGPQNCTNNNTRLKELPRLSLDSRKESLTRSKFDQNYDSPGQHRRSNSLIARLMGLELLPDLEAENGEKLNLVEIKTRRDVCLANNLRENVIKNSKFENEIQSSNLVVKTKRIGSESAPWRQQEKNVDKKMESEIEKKLQEFELRAKFRVENAKRGNKLNKKSEKIPKVFESPIVIMKPAKYGLKKKSHELEENNKSFQIKQTSRESGSNSPRTPPKISQKKGELDRKSRPSSPLSTNRNSANSLSDLNSPRSKISRPTSPQMNKNLSKKLDEVIKENASEKEMAVVSPVSVLDASFYRDELTPQKRLPDSFKDGDICTSEESWNPRSLPHTPPSDQIKSENIETLIQKLKQLSTANDELPSGDSINPETLKNKDHEYIHEILFASGLLNKDLNFIMQPQQSEYSINPDLFFVLEQTKTGEKNQRKLIFNLVNEILAQKLNSKLFICTKKVGGKQLFKDLCKEIDKIQTENLKRVEFECRDEERGEDFEIPDEEMIREMRGWEKFETEMQGMVFEIERSIFRDLIDEVIEMEAKDVTHANHNQRRIRRQLF